MFWDFWPVIRKSEGKYPKTFKTERGCPFLIKRKKKESTYNKKKKRKKEKITCNNPEERKQEKEYQR